MRRAAGNIFYAEVNQQPRRVARERRARAAGRVCRGGGSGGRLTVGVQLGTICETHQHKTGGGPTVGRQASWGVAVCPCLESARRRNGRRVSSASPGRAAKR